MPVQCNICLLSDTDKDWSVLNSCGHVFHMVCLQQELEFRNRCPICRVEVPKSLGSSLPFRKIFFELSDEPDGGMAGLAPCDGSVDVAAGHLQMQLLVKEQQVQQLKIEGKENLDRIKKLEEDLQVTQKSLRKKEEKLAHTITELNQMSKQNKAAHNELANVRAELKGEQTVSSRMRLVVDTTLQGESLGQELKKLMEQDVNVPSWFTGMLEERNKQISIYTNKLQQLERTKQQAEGHFKYETEKLQKQIANLQQQLESQQQRAADAVRPGRQGDASSLGFLPRAGFAGRSSRLAGALGPAFSDGLFGDEFADVAPAPYTALYAGSKPSLRHRMQRLSGKALATPPTGSAAQPAALQAAPSPQPAAAQPSHARQQHGQGLGATPGQAPDASAGVGEDGDGDYIVLEDSEDQLAAVGGDGGQAGADEGAAEEEEAGGGYSEVESEEELDIVEEESEEWEEGGARAAEKPCTSGAGAVLGKRRSSEAAQQHAAAAGRQRGQQAHLQQFSSPSWQAVTSSTGGASSSNGGGDGPGENVGPSALRPSNRAGYNPIPLKAGPCRLAVAGAPGPSFLRNPQSATTGLHDQAKYIHTGPDGKGGQVSVYRNGGAKPKAQTHIKPQAFQTAGGNKKQKSKAAATARGPANGGCTIDLFFNRAS